MISNETPDNLMVDAVVGMGEDIAESNDLRQILNPARGRRVVPMQPFESLTDNLEVPLHSLPRKTILQVLFEGTLLGDREDKCGGVPDVFQVLWALRLHTRPVVSDRPHG